MTNSTLPKRLPMLLMASVLAIVLGASLQAEDALQEPKINRILNPRNQDQDTGGAAPGEKLTVQGVGFKDIRPTAEDPCPATGTCPLPTKISVLIYDPAHPGKSLLQLLVPDAGYSATEVKFNLPADAVSGWIHVQLGDDANATVSPGIFYDVRPNKIDFFQGGAVSTELDLSLKSFTNHLSGGRDCPYKDYRWTLAGWGYKDYMPLSFGRDGSAYAAGKWFGFSENALNQSAELLPEACQNPAHDAISSTWIEHPDFRGNGTTRMTPGGATYDMPQSNCGDDPYNKYGGGNYSVGGSNYFQCATFGSPAYTVDDSGIVTPSSEPNMLVCTDPRPEQHWRYDHLATFFQLKYDPVTGTQSLAPVSGTHTVDTIFLPRGRRVERDQCSDNWSLYKTATGSGVPLYAGQYQSALNDSAGIEPLYQCHRSRRRRPQRIPGLRQREAGSACR